MAGGRQREFDKQWALEQAMCVFWKKGYVAASLADLTASMNINKPSMYATFGNKEDLFVSALDYYQERHSKSVFYLLHTESLSLRQRLSDYMTAIITHQVGASNPSGCLISLTTAEAASEALPEKAHEAISDAASFSEKYLTQFFEDEINQQNIHENEGAEGLAIYILSLMHGTAVQARNGKSLEQLLSVINIAISQLSFNK